MDTTHNVIDATSAMKITAQTKEAQKLVRKFAIGVAVTATALAAVIFVANKLETGEYED